MIITIEEYVEQIQFIVNRAGLMLSIDALLATSFVLFNNSQHNLSYGEKIYSLYLPLLLVGLAFYYHMQASMNAPSIVPIRHMKILASKYNVTNGSEEIQHTFNLAQESYGCKNHQMQLGSSFFIIAIPTLVFTNLVTANFLIQSVGFTDRTLTVSSVLLGVLGIILSLYTADIKFKQKSRQMQASFEIPNPPKPKTRKSN